MQIIAFFVLLNMNYPPFTFVFFQAIYQFVTFKIIPSDFLKAIGLAKEEDIEND
jgi:hypothetical protein